MIALVLWGVGLLAPLGLTTISDQELVGAAARAFGEGIASNSAQEARVRFARSADAYERLAGRGYRSPDLFRNLGNAYMLAGELPRAILAYRAGLRYAPGDAELRARLADARRLAVARSRMSGSAWIGDIPVEPVHAFWVAVALYTVACAAAARGLVTFGRAWFAASFAALVGAVVCGTPVAGHWQRERYEELYPTVVVARDGLQLRSGNGFSYPTRRGGLLTRGTEGARLARRGDWLQVEMPNGAVGWVEERGVVQATW